MNTAGTKSNCFGTAGSPYLDTVWTYRSFLVGLKTEMRRVVVGSIMGSPSPFAVELRSQPGTGTTITALAQSCSYQGSSGLETAYPPVRLAQFVSLFDRSASSSICQPDLSGGLTAIGHQVSLSIGTPCIGVELADIEPGTLGIQPDCVVEDVDDRDPRVRHRRSRDVLAPRGEPGDLHAGGSPGARRDARAAGRACDGDADALPAFLISAIAASVRRSRSAPFPASGRTARSRRASSRARRAPPDHDRAPPDHS